jgi:hypothetical protein
MRLHLAFLAAALAAVSVSNASAAERQYVDRAFASDVWGQLSYGGVNVPIGGMMSLSTDLTGDYSYDNASAASFAGTFYLPGKGAPGISLSTGPIGLEYETEPASFEAGQYSFAYSELDNGTTLSLVPPAGVKAPPLFSITLGTTVQAVLYAPSGDQASPSFRTYPGAVTISGTVLGSRVINVPASAPANTVAFQNATVKVTVNANLSVPSPACQGCPAQANGGEVDAVRIDLNGAIVNGLPLTGTLILGRDVAN